MIPPCDPDGDLPPGRHTATWFEFQERFCIFTHSDHRLQLCHRIGQMIAEARASHIVERVIFGGSFVSARPEPNDFDCIVVLQAGTHYETLQPLQRWVADTRKASRRYRGGRCRVDRDDDSDRSRRDYNRVDDYRHISACFRRCRPRLRGNHCHGAAIGRQERCTSISRGIR